MLIWVAKGDSCRIPSCVTLLPDTFGGTSETWLGPERGLKYWICRHLTYAVRPLAAARATLDAVVCFLIPARRVWASARAQ